MDFQRIEHPFPRGVPGIESAARLLSGSLFQIFQRCCEKLKCFRRPFGAAGEVKLRKEHYRVSFPEQQQRRVGEVESPFQQRHPVANAGLFRNSGRERTAISRLNIAPDGETTPFPATGVRILQRTFAAPVGKGFAVEFRCEGIQFPHSVFGTADSQPVPENGVLLFHNQHFDAGPSELARIAGIGFQCVSSDNQDRAGRRNLPLPARQFQLFQQRLGAPFGVMAVELCGHPGSQSLLRHKSEGISRFFSVGIGEHCVQDQFLRSFRRETELHRNELAFSGGQCRICFPLQFQGRDLPDAADGCRMHGVIEQHQRFANRFPFDETGVLLSETIRSSGDASQQGAGRFPDRFADQIGSSAEVERRKLEKIGRNPGTLQVFKAVLPQFRRHRLPIPELVVIPKSDSGEAVSAEIGNRFAEHHCLQLRRRRAPQHPGVATQRCFPVAEHLHLHVEELILHAVEPVCLVTEVLCDIFVDPDRHHLRTGPDEIRSPVTGPARQMGDAVLHKHKRHLALGRPQLKIIAPFLKRHPVEIAVECDDFTGDAGRVVVERTRRIELADDLFRLAGDFIVARIDHPRAAHIVGAEHDGFI